MSSFHGTDSGVQGYIDDKALDARADDRFHLGALADELACLVVTQRPPLNVAVFGPWGSGKSSLAKLLQDALEERSRSTKFVPMDAWKYTEDSFRRQFIMESAKLLGLDAEEYRKKLYEKQVHSELKMPRQALWLLVKVLLILLAAFLALLLLAGLIVGLAAAASNGKAQFLTGFNGFVKGIAPTVVVSASVLTALFAFAGKLFVRDVTQSEVASTEHFENVFKELIRSVTDKAGIDRIVFYVDELDRCAAKDVVAVLEGIRTFLDVDKCVFIVAADNRVLELAVQQEIPHPVPDEEANPYYSSGAEYLDKLFQHQVAIPALLPHRLTAFALELVTGRSGVWAEAAERRDLANLVSVLLPSHVRSPRRVKVLLNGFVSLHRVARARHEEEPDYVPDPCSRLLELAKLSTLRLEFPLFYRDLVRYPRLAEHLTAYICNNDEWPNGMQAKAKTLGDSELVELYACRDRPVEAMLSSLGQEVSASDERDATEEDEHSAVSGSDSARRGELLSYLLKTANIPGPSRDIVFLEGTGSPFGIPGELAELMEEAAADNDLAALVTQVEGLPEDARIGVIRLLHEARRHVYGLEATNVLAAVMHLIGEAQLVDPTEVASELISDLTLESADRPLPTEWLPAAVKIGLVAQRPAGRDLASNCLRDPRLFQEDREEEALGVLAAVGNLSAEIGDEVSDLLVGRDSGFIATAVEDGALSVEEVGQLAARTPMLESLAEKWKTTASEEDREDVMQLSEALRAADPPSEWALAEALAKAGQALLADAWVSTSPPPLTTSQQTGTLLRVLCIASRQHWESSETLFDKAPKTGAVVLYTVARTLFSDIDENPPDDSHAAMQRVLASVWGSPAWPRGWDSESPPDWVITPSWTEGNRRERKFSLLRRLARIDTNAPTFWRRAVAQGYSDVIAQSGTPPDTVERVGALLADDWPLFDPETRAGVIEALASGAGLPEDTRRLWRARVSLVDERVSFPFGKDDVPSLVNGSAADNEAVRLWLEHRGSAVDTREFVQREDCGAETYIDAVIAGAHRFSSSEVALVAADLVDRGLLSDSSTVGPLLAFVDEQQFAAWLAEKLRAASNQQERERLLRLWVAWLPTTREVRRTLIGAYVHVASSGKGGLELALRHIGIVENPPKGLKKTLVETLTARASLYGLEKQARQALLKAGLVKKVRKGLLRREKILTEDDD
jgi:energy-coupling factor transporter ATP-binding protein EcfA2